jgi:predicted  nucleic acid-binding Zn-ribbon protein
MQQLTEECSQLRQKRQNLEDELVDLNKLTREGTTNLQKWKMEIRVRQSKGVVLQTGLLE